MGARVGTNTLIYNDNTATQTSISGTHTVDSQAKLLVAFLIMQSGSPTPSGPSMTYNSVAMSAIGSATATSGNTLMVAYYMLTPPTGAHTIAASWTTSASYMLAALNILDCSPNSAPRNGNGATGSGTSQSVTLTNRGGNLLLACNWVSNIAAVITGAQTEDWDQGARSGGGISFGSAGEHANGNGSTKAMAFTTDLSVTWGVIGFEIVAGLEGNPAGFSPVMMH